MRRQNGRSRKKNMAKVSLRNIKKVYPNSAPKKKAKDQPEKKHNLQITDEGVVAVQEFNLDIADKEFIVLVGPSGCGKSTTLRMIAGLEDITAGELYIGDKLMNDVAPKDRDIAMVFQNYALYPHMTVYENMAFSLKLKKVPKDEIDKKVRQAAEILDITQYLDRKPKALSGGQRQRVAIGRAIVRDLHTNVVLVEQDGVATLDKRDTDTAAAGDSDVVTPEQIASFLTVRSIWDYCTKELDPMNDPIDIIRSAVKVNSVISDEGLSKEYGLAIGTVGNAAAVAGKALDAQGQDLVFL